VHSWKILLERKTVHFGGKQLYMRPLVLKESHPSNDRPWPREVANEDEFAEIWCLCYLFYVPRGCRPATVQSQLK
jgi:hypothetical protein